MEEKAGDGRDNEVVGTYYEDVGKRLAIIAAFSVRK